MHPRGKPSKPEVAGLSSAHRPVLFTASGVTTHCWSDDGSGPLSLPGRPLTQSGVYSWRTSESPSVHRYPQMAELVDPDPALPGGENPGPSDLSLILEFPVPPFHYHHPCLTGEELPPRNVLRMS